MKTKLHVMLKRALLLVVTLLGLGGMGATTEIRADSSYNCQPSAEEIALFTGENFSGPCVIKGIGRHDLIQTSGNSKLPGLTLDVIHFSSIKVGANVETLACAGPNLNGPCILVYYDEASLSSRGPGRRSAISSAASFIVRHENEPLKCQPSADQVATWTREHFFGDCHVSDARSYSANLNPVRSLKVGQNVEITLCNGYQFEGACVTVTHGIYSNWSFQGEPRQVGDHDMAISVRGVNDCRPSASQVVLFEFSNSAGPCKVFDIGTHSLNETLGWLNGVRTVRSLQVGDNAQGTLCFDLDRERRCSTLALSHPLNLRPNYTIYDHSNATLTVQRRGEIPPRASRPGDETGPEDKRDSPDEITHPFQLAAQPFFEGSAWWQGTFPGSYRDRGTLLGVKNLTPAWIGLLKPSKTNADCLDPQAYVFLDKDGVMTADQMRDVFGSPNPALPVTFRACSGLIGRSTDHGLEFDPVTLELRYILR